VPELVVIAMFTVVPLVKVVFVTPVTLLLYVLPPDVYSAQTVYEPLLFEALSVDPEVAVLANGWPGNASAPVFEVAAFEAIAGVQLSVHEVPLELAKVSFTRSGTTREPPNVTNTFIAGSAIVSVWVDPGLTDASSVPVGGSICGHLPAHTW
jgi:hypothetical protein